MPPPAALENFNRIVPGAAERIIAMADAEQKHRHELERSAMLTQQEAVRLAAFLSLPLMIVAVELIRRKH